MTVITTLIEKRKEKRLKYERRLLRELSLKALRKKIQQVFESYTLAPQATRYLEDYCLELAIESYLLGANYSKFGYHGESLAMVKTRSLWEEQELTETLYQFLSNMPSAQLPDDSHDGLYEMCHTFIDSWWREGYDKGERRHRLRLH